MFWLPLAWLGFSPKHIVIVVAINLGFRFFVHTEAVGKPGWLEHVFNPPSHHRVHHTRNPKYIDRSYAGVLIVWDQLFGSFVEEDPDVPKGRPVPANRAGAQGRARLESPTSRTCGSVREKNLA